MKTATNMCARIARKRTQSQTTQTKASRTIGPSETKGKLAKTEKASLLAPPGSCWLPGSSWLPHKGNSHIVLEVLFRNLYSLSWRTPEAATLDTKALSGGTSTAHVDSQRFLGNPLKCLPRPPLILKLLGGKPQKNI